MIRFLHKTREYLMHGNARKFVLYTISEIVLIVLGILIALSIDNWNEGRKNLAKEQELLPNVNEILKSTKIEGLLAVAVLYNYSGNIQSYTLRDRVHEILGLLDKEITDKSSGQ